MKFVTGCLRVASYTLFSIKKIAYIFHILLLCSSRCLAITLKTKKQPVLHSRMSSEAYLSVTSLLHCKGTPHTQLWSPYQSSRVTLQPIKYYYIIFGLTPIILSILCCLLVHFHCSDPGYQMQGREDTVIYILQVIPSRSLI